MNEHLVDSWWELFMTSDIRKYHTTLCGGFHCDLTTAEQNLWTVYALTAPHYHAFLLARAAREAWRFDSNADCSRLVDCEISTEQAMYGMAAVWYADLRKKDEPAKPRDVRPSDEDLQAADDEVSAARDAYRDAKVAYGKAQVQRELLLAWPKSPSETPTR